MNDLATKAPSEGLSEAIMEQVLVHGDLARLSVADRLRWYISRCEAIGLDPRTQPFQYIPLGGKLVLYATRAATDQIRQIRSVSVEDIKSHREGDCYVVTCRVRDGSGRVDVSTAAVSIKGLAGDALANALMRCETKAKRRATLALCGLGMLDESELDTIPELKTAPLVPALTAAEKREAASNGSEYGHGKYADPETVSAFRHWALARLQAADARWADDLDSFGYATTKKDYTFVVGPYQLVNHLLKWAIGLGHLKPLGEYVDAKGEVRPSRPSTEQAKGMVALVWARLGREVQDETDRYIHECAATKWSQLEAEIGQTEDAADHLFQSKEEPGANG